MKEEYVEKIKGMFRPAVHKYIAASRRRMFFNAKRQIESYIETSPDTKRNLFVDCGSNIGQGFGFFSKLFKPGEYDYYLIEPNPHCEQALKKIVDEHKDKCTIDFINKAVCADSGTIELLSFDNDLLSEGSSILPEHGSCDKSLQYNTSYEVEKLQFSDFIKEQSIQYDKIIVKMDIECAEYDVLESLIKNDLHIKINLLIVEFHSGFMSMKNRVKYKKRERKILKSLEKDSVPTVIWI